MKPPGKWVSFEEAIELTMQACGCSRRQARRMVVKGIKDQKVRARRVPQSDPDIYSVTGEAAVDAYEEGSTTVFKPLGELFFDLFHFELTEIMGELQSGRLVARARPDTIAWAEAGRAVNPNEFEITMKALRDWMNNPETPPYLLHKAAQALKQKNN